MKTGVSGVNTFPERLREQAGLRGPRPAVLGGEREPGADRGGRAGATRPPCRPPSTRLTSELAGDPAFGPVQDAGRPSPVTWPCSPCRSTATPSAILALDKVRELRGTLIPQAFDGSGASVYVTGQTAGNVDYIDIVNSYFPWVVALVLGLSFLLLLVAFRSVVIPAKAIVMNLLSVGAAYGLVTLVSLKGWGAGLLGFQQVAADRAVGAAVPVRGAVRPLHGLPGVPAEPHQGGVGPHRRQHARGDARASAPRPASSPARR